VVDGKIVKMKSVIFLHGFMGSSLNWKRVIDELKKNFDERVNFQAIDLLWHSRNYRPDFPDKNLIEVMCADIVKKLTHDPSDSIVVAHSFGLRPLMKLSEPPFSKKFKAWVVEDSMPVLSRGGYDQLSDILQKTPVPFATRKLASEYFNNAFPSKPEMAQFLMTNIGDLTPQAWTWKFNPMALQKLLDEAIEDPLWEIWEKSESKIYLLHGEKSKVTPESLVEKARLLRQNRHLETFLFAQSEHWLHYDKFEYFVQLLKKIIRS
jgi:pimeloyl-ACP methyl ester carboxylesterase